MLAHRLHIFVFLPTRNLGLVFLFSTSREIRTTNLIEDEQTRNWRRDRLKITLQSERQCDVHRQIVLIGTHVGHPEYSTTTCLDNGYLRPSRRKV